MTDTIVSSPDPAADTSQGRPKIGYTVHGLDEQGDPVDGRAWAELVGEARLPDLRIAYTQADRALADYGRLSAVQIRESVQDAPGQPWREGRLLDTVHRDPVTYNVLTPVVELLPARSAREAMAEHAKRLESSGFEVYSDGETCAADAFVSED